MFFVSWARCSPNWRNQTLICQGSVQFAVTTSDQIAVLYVNDDPDLLRLVSERLEREREHLTIHRADSVEGGLSILQSEDIDCILSDYHMPDRNGLDFLRTVRAEDDEIPFILFTETGDETVASESISAGVTDYVIQEAIGNQSELLANKITTHVEHVRARRAAEYTNQQLRELAETTRNVLWVFSADWSEVRFINSAYEDIFGQPVDALRDDPQSILAQVYEEDRDRVAQAMERVSNGGSLQIEYRVEYSDEIRLWVESRGQPGFDEDGEVDYVAGFTRDISEQKSREETLSEKRNQLEQFSSTVAHDLRNPLNIADGNLELAREECDSEHIDIAAEAISEMDVLIDELLALAQKGETIDERSHVEFTDLIQAGARNIVLDAATRDIRDTATLDCDPSRMREAIENLFRNAVEHGGEDVTIVAGVLDDGDGFYIEDDGPGIPADKRDVVFERGHSSSHHGSGLGLAIVEQIVDAHGWEIAAGEGADGGARFTISGVDSLSVTSD